MASSAKFSSLYQKLNPEQKRAVDTIEGPVMVIAGPGTGKTQILTLRITNILQKTDVPPDAILALTFTESAAAGMRRRLIDIIGSAAYRVRLHTFHGYANDVIERFPDAFPRIIGARAISDAEKILLMQSIIAKEDLEVLRPFGDPYYYVQKALSKISELKREQVSVEEYASHCATREAVFNALPDLYHEKGAHKGAMRGEYTTRAKRLARDRELAAVYRRYEEELASHRWYDYEDMLGECVRTLERDRTILLSLQEEAQYLLADEHQDANASQNKLLELLASFHEQPNLFVVGDEKQAIYRFQGASLDNFSGFLRAHPGVQTIALQENYRSVQGVLDGAHTLMEHAPMIEGIDRPRLRSAGKGSTDAASIRAISLPTPVDERAFVVKEIAKLVEEGVEPDEIAVLFRTNRDAELFAPELERRGIPCVAAIDRDAFSDHAIVQFIDLLAAIDRYGDDVALVPVLHAGFLDLPPLDVARFLARSGGRSAGKLFEALSNKEVLAEAKVRKPRAFLELSQKLERWKKVQREDGLLALLDTAAEASGLVAHLLSKDAPEERIAALQAIFDEARALQETDRGAGLSAFLERLNILREHHLGLSASRASSKRHGVQLMTAHRAKGLEFAYVYLMHANDGHWGNRTSRELFSPIYEQAVPSDDTDDQSDERRLFYVALTRAKLQATITLARENETGRPLLPSQFLEEMSAHAMIEERGAQEDPMRLRAIVRAPRTRLDKALVRELFEAQGLSVTALNNYLSCPWSYFYRNLVRIPEAPARSAEYGTAIHEALRQLYEKRREGEDFGAAQLVQVFEQALQKSPLCEQDIAETLAKGLRALPAFYEQRCSTPESTDAIINELKITALLPLEIEGLPRLRLRGALDRVEHDGGGHATVFDYKTGKRKTRGAIEGKKQEGGEDDASLWGDYKRQLVFYQLLLQHFDGGKWRMERGIIEFIEPDEKTGKCAREIFEARDADVCALTTLIQNTARDIWNLSFAKSHCNDVSCRYCPLRGHIEI